MTSEKVKRFRARKRERMTTVADLSAEMLKWEIFEDLDIKVTPTKWGTLEVTYDMSKETEAILEAYAINKGMTLDDLLSGDMLQDAIQLTLANASKRREQIEVADRAVQAFARLMAFELEHNEGLEVQVDVVGDKDRVRLSGQASDDWQREFASECQRRGYVQDKVWGIVMATMADHEVRRRNAR